MINEIQRKEVPSILEKYLDNKYNKVIVTGLDRAGKSTIIKEYFAKFPTFKSGEYIGELYHNDAHEVVRDLVDSYQLYDRHPAITRPVYAAAHLQWSDDEFYRQRCRYCYRLKNFSAVICFLNDKFLDEELEISQGTSKEMLEFEKHYRQLILNNYETMMQFLSEYLRNRLNLYVVRD